MTRYVLTRLLHTIPVLIVTTLLVFVILSFSPSDPAQLVLGLGATQEQLEAMREQLGLNEPLPVRYVKYMAGVLTGDFGVSYTTNRPVAELIGTRLPNTLILAFGSLLLVLLVALPLGIALAVRQNSVFDNVMRVVTLVTAAMPSFWLGLMLILLFSVQLRWLPSSGLDSIKAAILPLVCLSVAGWTVTSRLARASMLDVISQDYIRTARAKGLKERVVLGKHAFRNALLPVVTSVGLMIGQSVGGAVVIEILFGINGVGKLMVDAVRQQDVPTIMGGVLISAVVIAVANLLTDLSYAAIDPRLKTMYDGPA
ncbi:MAG TPA: ABC transporter permease [Deinococcales bacterium]|nr:ABC transporter permease [Deinococcales bacterium]